MNDVQKSYIYLKRVLIEWREFCKSHRNIESSIETILNYLEESEMVGISIRERNERKHGEPITLGDFLSLLAPDDIVNIKIGHFTKSTGAQCFISSEILKGYVKDIRKDIHNLKIASTIKGIYDFDVFEIYCLEVDANEK